MKLLFAGTRGGIKISSRLHRLHSSTILLYCGKRILLDCGTDWLGHLDELKPDALFITHAHPDHVGGLKNGITCPVYATKEVWEKIKRYPIEDKHVIKSQEKISLYGLTIQPWTVEHSLRAPAVGYRISSQNKTLFYVSDVAAIPRMKKALGGCDLYIGDGAIITRRMLVRRRDHMRIGHAPIDTQLSWCHRQGIKQAIFTHCGSEITRGPQKKVEAKVAALACHYDIDVMIAVDGLEITV